MREIRFRAWVKYTTDHQWDWAYKKAEEKISVNQDLDDDATRIRSEFMDEWAKNNSPEKRYSFKEYMTNFDEVSISLSGRLTKLINLEVLDVMQFTGLKDKNGRSVFESDIVTALDEMSGHEIKGEVKYFENLAYFAVEFIDSENEVGHLRFNDLLKGSVEVIGDIFENPELLKEEE